MKKLLALLLALLMVLSLAACGEGDEEETSRRRKKNTETTSDTTEETEPEEEEEEETEPEEEEEDSPYTIFEELDVTVVDDKGITLSIGEFESGSWGNLVAEVEAENTSGGKVNVALQSAAVNGKMSDEFFYFDLEDDATDTSELEIFDMEDPEDLTRLSMLIRVTDEDYENDFYLIDIYPQGKKAYKEKQPDRDGDDVLLDDEGLYAVNQGMIYSDNWDPQLRYLAFNDSNEALYLNLDPTAINSFAISTYHGYHILPDTYADKNIDLYPYADLLALGMEDEVTSLTMNVTVETLDYDKLYEKQLTIYPEGKKNETTFEYEPEKDDVVVLETDDFKLLQVSYEKDDWNDVEIMFVLINKTGKTLSIYGDNTKLNGKAAENIYFSCYSDYGLDSYCITSIYESELSALKLSQITSMEMTLEVWDEEYNDLYEGTVKFDVK